MGETTAGHKLCFQSFLPCRIKAINERSLRLLDAIHEGYDISTPEFGVLVVVTEQPNLSSRDITQLTGMDKATLTRALDRLSKKGLINRQRCSEDSRLIRISLTEAGHALFREIEREALEWEKALLKGISTKELAKLYSILNNLDQNLAYLEQD